MHLDGFMNAGVSQYARQLAAGRMRKRHMSNDSFSEKSGDAIFGPVKELIRNEKFSRPQIFLQRTDRAHGDDAFHAQELHRVNVRAVINLAWQNAVPAAVAR